LAGHFPSAAWPPARLHFLTETHGPLGAWQAEYWTNMARRLLWDLRGLPLVMLALVGIAAAGLLAWVERHERPEGLAHEESGSLSDGASGMLRFAGWLAGGVVLSVLLWGQLRYAADRFLAPVLLSSVVILAVSLQWLAGWFARRNPAAGAVGRGRLAVLILLVILGFQGFYRNAAMMGETGFGRRVAAQALGRESPMDYWRAMLGLTADLFEAADRLPENSRIVAVNEARRYAFTRQVDLASVFDESPIRPAVTGAADGETIRRRLAEAGFTHLLVNEFEQDRVLRVHTPLGLLNDGTFRGLLEKEEQGSAAERSVARQALAERYWGYTEFSVDPLSAQERRAYGEFLAMMRGRALWLQGAGPAQRPAMWIAPLR
jgi:hypothetical protein